MLDTLVPGPLSAPAHSGHFVRFYQEDGLLLDEVAEFLDTSLRAGGAGIVIASADHVAGLRRRLAGLGAPAGHSQWFSGELIVLDAAQTLARIMVDGWPDQHRFDDVVGKVVHGAAAQHGTVHAFGEMVALLCADGLFDAAVQLEVLWNRLADRHAFSLFCAYPWGLFPTAQHAESLRQVCGQHDHACSHSHRLQAPRDVHLRLVELEQKALALEAEVTRRKEAEQTLRRRELELADFMENAAEGLHRVGPDGTILWANRAELELLGYAWQEYVGHNIAEFHVDRPVLDDILARLRSGQTLYDRPARLRCRDGSIRHVLMHSNACIEDGRLRYTRCFTRDATARHERDEALAQRDRMLLQAPVAAALLLGPDLVFHLANRRYAEMVHRTALVGQPFLSVFPELADSELLRLLRRVLETGEPFASEELPARLERADGTAQERFLKIGLEPLAAEGDAAQGVILVAVDITEHVRCRQGLERSQAEREELLVELSGASRVKDEFLAMLGHELRNPLSPIVTALQLMRMRGDTGTSREQGIIQRQVEHLVRLVDDLLDISRVTRGKVALKKERVELSQVLTKAVEMASLLFEQRSHQLALDIEPGVQWEGDPVRLSQVVANLLTNAARYTDSGGQIQLRAGRSGPDELRIGVKDNGIGISPELQARVFDLFFQGARSVDRAEGGLGIGLALVKNIVELHGGRVEVMSPGVGLGSEFVVHLPLRAPIGEGVGLPAPGGAAIQPAARQRRVLVVDDNVDGADTLGRLLAAAGHLVEVFHEPAGALKAVQRFQPEMAILDIGLPAIDGYELAGCIQALLPGHACRMVALTGYGQDADRERSKAVGFERHLVKPVNPDEVVRWVNGD